MEQTRILANQAFTESLIPQKFPFVMIDKMLDYTETSVTAGHRVTATNIFCADGLFREPGIVEHMAQSVALHTGYQFHLRNEAAPTGYIGSISGIQINRLPALHEELVTSVQILQEFGGITLVEITTCVADVVIASGQMKTVLAK